MTKRTYFLALALASLPFTAGAEDYVGTLKLPPNGLPEPVGLYSFSAINPPLLASAAAPGDIGFRLKLGYKYSRYLQIEGEVNDLARAPADPFAMPGLASGFRATGFGVDTVATLPLSRFSFYGRMGAYRGEPRFSFSTYSTSLLASDAARTRWRYGLGVRYALTDAFGVRAEMERYSPLASPLTSEPDSDLFSLGVTWRF